MLIRQQLLPLGSGAPASTYFRCGLSMTISFLASPPSVTSGLAQCTHYIGYAATALAMYLLHKICLLQHGSFGLQTLCMYTYVCMLCIHAYVVASLRRCHLKCGSSLSSKHTQTYALARDKQTC